MSNQEAPVGNNELRAAIIDMDILSQNAFREIASIARLSLTWLETPDGNQHLEVIADALNAIWYKANNAEENIGLEAERVGCEYVDRARIRRTSAAEEVRKGVSHA